MFDKQQDVRSGTEAKRIFIWYEFWYTVKGSQIGVVRKHLESFREKIGDFHDSSQVSILNSVKANERCRKQWGNDNVQIITWKSHFVQRQITIITKVTYLNRS